ncbi:class I SAM-dependent methyltransferase [uncultured Hymenobacter sp.]|uniref:class I SAM-dependent methyltransferase n=1 Tax=uncultured Hymenobacter sp. TaxID=170016 RepID=UPI0035CA01C2
MSTEEFAPLFRACGTTTDLDQLIETQQQALTLALYTLDVHSPAGLQQAYRCYTAFTTCPPYEEQQASWQFTSPVAQAQLLFATVFERAGSFNLIEVDVLPPTSSITLRLRAQRLFNNLLNIQRDYTAVFREVMDLLLRAQFEGEADHTIAVTQVAHNFLEQGHRQLQQYNFLTEDVAFCNLFRDPTHQQSYSFLQHPALAELLAGRTGGSLLIRPADAATVLFPTAFIQDIFRRHILNPVNQDPRTRGHAAPLGYSSADIRAHILEYGKADFAVECRTVSPPAAPADRVLLYCYYNLRKHFFTSRYVFGQLIDSLPSLLATSGSHPVFLDLGCGPMTSALALADLYGERFNQPLPIRYVGVDIAQAMLDKARTFETSGLFADGSHFTYFTRWADALGTLVEQIQVTNPVIINASYLFASSSLNPMNLAVFVHELRRQCPVAKMYFLFQNPNRTDRNAKYYAWRQEISFAHSLVHTTQSVYYQTSSFGTPSEEEVTYELLAFQPS